MQTNEPKRVKLKMRGCRWCKWVRNIKAKRHRINRCKTRPWSTREIATAAAAATNVVIVMTSVCHGGTGDDKYAHVSLRLNVSTASSLD
jgi:hypothetical protein